MTYLYSIDWFKGKNTGKSHISWENRWFPADFPLSQPIEEQMNSNKQLSNLGFQFSTTKAKDSLW